MSDASVKAETMNTEIKVDEKIFDNKKKEKKKWKPKGWQIILMIVAILVVVGIIAGQKAAKLASVVFVEAQEATEGPIVQTVDTSGTIQSEESKTYFAPVSAKITALSVKEGGSIKKGDMLVTFDTSDLESQLEDAKLGARISELGSEIAIDGINYSEGKVAEAAVKYEENKKFAAHYSDCVVQIKDQLAKAAALQGDMAKLAGEMEQLSGILQLNPEDKDATKKLKKKQEKYEELEKEYKKYDVDSLNSALEVCSSDLAEYKALQAEYEAKKEAGDPTAAKQKSQQSLMKQQARLSTQDIEDAIAKAQEGVVSEFNGIASVVACVEGQTAMEGGELFVIQNADKLKVTISASKYDMEKLALGQKATIKIGNSEYTGQVSNISKVAGVNASGAITIPVDIHIDNPDDSIILGTEAKVSIETANKENVVLVPNSAVNYASDGVFVYVVKDGKLAKTAVEAGVSTAENTEILSGVGKGDMIVTKVTADMAEGMEVSVIDPNAESKGDGLKDYMQQSQEQTGSDE